VEEEFVTNDELGDVGCMSGSLGDVHAQITKRLVTAARKELVISFLESEGFAPELACWPISSSNFIHP
jgi:hypothetical protein